MENQKKRPFITVTEALISSAVLFLTAVAFEKIDLTPQVPLRSVLEAEVSQFAEQIVDLPISQIARKIETSDGKPTLMVIYASWCAYCKLLLPKIAALKNEGDLNNIHLLFISLDEDKRKLSTYILQRNYDRIYDPYMLENNSVKGLDNFMITKGSSYNGSIPYTVIFDSKGKLVSTLHGTVDKPSLREFIEDAVANLQSP